MPGRKATHQEDERAGKHQDDDHRDQLLQFRMIQAAFVPITLKDGHQVPPVPIDSSAE
jgi:hypothetical protein